MLNENIKTLRKSKGLSQEELAVRLNVVRQTVSKWEQGLSVPDSDMLIAISEALETPVSALLGENITAAPADDLRAIAEKLEVINSQLAERKMPKEGCFIGCLLPSAPARQRSLPRLRSSAAHTSGGIAPTPKRRSLRQLFTCLSICLSEQLRFCWRQPSSEPC